MPTSSWACPEAATHAHEDVGMPPATRALPPESRSSEVLSAEVIASTNLVKPKNMRIHRSVQAWRRFGTGRWRFSARDRSHHLEERPLSSVIDAPVDRHGL